MIRLKIFGFIFILFFLSRGFSIENIPADWGLYLRQELVWTQAARFPELKGHDIEIVEFSSEEDFFQARVRPSSLFFGNRIYQILWNKRLQQGAGLSDQALRGVLTHELCHLVDYQKKNVFEILSLAWLYLTEPRSARVVAYERSTDACALRRHAKDELLAYRLWLYQKLDGEALEFKKKAYYTPEELSALR